jgi:hypothetical protein
MESSHTAQRHAAWNKGKLVGQKTPFKLKEIWAIRIRLQMPRSSTAARGREHQFDQRRRGAP